MDADGWATVTVADYRGLTVMVRRGSGWNGTYPCGYVAVPPDHPWYGKSSSESVPPPASLLARQGSLSLDDVGVIGAFCAAVDRGRLSTPEMLVRAWQGLTFSGRMSPTVDPEQRWWFGFDCAHSVDRDDPKSDEFALEWCRTLADDLLLAADPVACRAPVTPLARITEATRGILAVVDVPAEWSVTVTFPTDSEIGRLVSDVCRRGGCNWTHTPDAIVDVSPYKTEPEVTLRRTVGLDEARRTLAGCDYEAGVAIKAAYP